MIAWAIAFSITLNALGKLAINLAIAYAITKKANHKDQLIHQLSKTTIEVNDRNSLASFHIKIISWTFLNSN